MALNKTPPLEERIKSICAEAEAVVDARAAELKKVYEGLPLTMLRRGLENKAPGCACRQALAILAGEGE
jgi:cytidine deaminase